MKERLANSLPIRGRKGIKPRVKGLVNGSSGGKGSESRLSSCRIGIKTATECRLRGRKTEILTTKIFRDGEGKKEGEGEGIGPQAKSEKEV